MGSIRAWRPNGVDRRLSPDSCRLGRMPATAELGHKETIRPDRPCNGVSLQPRSRYGRPLTAGIRMRRREFIAVLGGAAAWPLAAQAQPAERMRRIGVLMPTDEDPLAKTMLSAFTQALAGLGWADGRNVRMDLRWQGDDVIRTRVVYRFICHHMRRRAAHSRSSQSLRPSIAT